MLKQDELIEMARQADKGFDGGPDADGTMEDSIVGIDAVIRFAKLVAEKAVERERERMLDIQNSLGKPPLLFKTMNEYKAYKLGVSLYVNSIRARGINE